MPRRVFRVTAEQAGERLDRFLVALLDGELSRARVQELIREGAVVVEGAPAERPSQLLAAGQEIVLVISPRAPRRAGGPSQGELVLLFEDEHLAVIDKPAGTLAHPTSAVGGGTVSELAAARWGALPTPQGDDRPGVVHRLDADTSGLMVLALSQAAGEPLVQAFRERTVEKVYLALVHGEPRFDSDWIETPIGRARGRPDRMAVLDGGEGRPAATFYLVRERFARFALVECRPRTGRTHQIRVHLSSIDHALVGDRVYPGRVRQPIPPGAPALERHLLHASALRFAHPVTGAQLSFESAPPPEFTAWLDWLRAR